MLSDLFNYFNFSINKVNYRNNDENLTSIKVITKTKFSYVLSIIVVIKNSKHKFYLLQKNNYFYVLKMSGGYLKKIFMWKASSLLYKSVINDKIVQ